MLTLAGLAGLAFVIWESNMTDDQIESEEFFVLLEKLMRTPTAPFREQKVRETVTAEVAKVPKLSVRQDPWGNLLISHGGGNLNGGCVFCAHMDHPGFVDGAFLGSIRPEYLQKSNGVTQFDGGIGMWDLPAFERVDGWIRSRACDDLVGCGVALAAVFHHARTQSPYNVHALLTVAEEVGLFGAALACVGGLVPRDSTVISLETSPALSEAQFHAGCIVRVGDKQSIFSPSVTQSLLVAAGDCGIKHQRKLMDGGSCEGSIFWKAGYQTGALCVALGNAHNQGPAGKIAMEYVSEVDVIEMLRLAIATPSAISECHGGLLESVEKVAECARREFSIRTEKNHKS